VFLLLSSGPIRGEGSREQLLLYRTSERKGEKRGGSSRSLGGKGRPRSIISAPEREKGRKRRLPSEKERMRSSC